MNQLTHALRSLRRSREGNLTVEFALIAPLMLAFFFGIVEFARISYTQSALNFAAEETTRYAVVNGGNVTNSELLTYAQGKLIGLKDGLATFCLMTPVDAATDTSTVSITITYDFDLILPVPISPVSLEGKSEGYISFSPSIRPTT